MTQPGQAAPVDTSLPADTGGEPLLQRVAFGAAGTLGLKLAGAALGYTAIWLLARRLGPQGFGTYAYGLSWIALLTIPSLLGFPKLLIREVATLEGRSDWGRIKGLLRHSRRVSFLLAVLIAAVGWAAAGAVDDPGQRTVLRLAMLLVPLQPLVRLDQAALQGLRRVALGHMSEFLIEPLMLTAALVALVVAGALTPPTAMLAKLAATAIAVVAGRRLLLRRLPTAVRAADARHDRRWLSSSLGLALVGTIYVVHGNTDSVMLGLLSGPEAVGLYSVAGRLAAGVLFILIMANKALAPEVAKLYSGGRREELQAVVTKTVRMLVLLALPLWVALVVFGEPILSLFGAEFVAGRMALATLATAQLISVACGSAALLLIMTGEESAAAKSVGVSAIANLVLNYLLIPRWGVNGAAVATAASLALVNTLQALAVRRQLGIRATAFENWGAVAPLEPRVAGAPGIVTAPARRTPDYIVVGAPRCGTTSMHRYLTRQRGVFVAREKEPHFFTDAELPLRESRSWEQYLGLFEEAPLHAPAGEVSVWYLSSPQAAEEIYRRCGPIRIVAMLRDPVTAMHSLHAKLRFTGDEDVASFESALELESDRLAGRSLPAGSWKAAECHCYRHVYSFGTHLARYIDRFGADNVHPLLLDDLQTEPEATFRDLLDFLGVDHPITTGFEPVNANLELRSRRVQRLLRGPYNRVRRTARIVLPFDRVRQSVGRSVRSALLHANSREVRRPPLDPALREKLITEMEPEIRRLEALLGRDLSHWRSASGVAGGGQ